MITDVIVGAMDTMIDLCSDPAQKRGMMSLREMLCDLDVDRWHAMNAEEEREWLSQFLNNQSEAAFMFIDAKKDILSYLSTQEDTYFSERGRTKEDVLQDEPLIDLLAAEHLKCVTRFGNEREWSCKDACDVEPGIRAAATIKPSLNNQIQSASTRAAEPQAADKAPVKESTLER